MFRYTATEIKKYPYVRESAMDVASRVQAVAKAIASSDNTPVDTDPRDGYVRFQEDCCVVERRKGRLTITAMANTPENFLTTDSEKCLAESKLPVRFGVGGFKPVAVEQHDEELEVVGYDILEKGWKGPVRYVVEPRGQHQLLTIEMGRYLQRSLVDGAGRLLEYSVGSPGWKDALPSWLPFVD